MNKKLTFLALAFLLGMSHSWARDDANGGEYDILDHFHKVLLGFSIKIFDFSKTVK